MKTCLLLAALLLFAPACGHEECPGDPAIDSLTLSASQVAAGGTIDVTMHIENFQLGEHAGKPVRHGDVSACLEGMVHIYLDDTMSNPVAMATTSPATVTIPAGTTAGAHKLIGRLHLHDHMILMPEVKAEASFDVQ